MTRASFGSTFFRCATAFRQSNAEAGVAVEELRLRHDGSRGALEREHAELGVDAAGRREAARLAAGREHAVTRHDDRERVPSERLPDRARRARGTDAGRDLAVRERRPGRDRARRFVHLAMERRHAVHVERDRRELDRLPVEQLPDGHDRALDARRRRRLARVGKALLHAEAGGAHASFGKLQPEHAALAPGDAAAADRGIEEREAGSRHGADPSSTTRGRNWRILRRLASDSAGETAV